MSSLNTSLVALAVILGGALVGVALRKTLPERHLAEDTKDRVRLGTGLIGTIAALVLGLLIAAVPFGAIRRVVNYSWDWMIMKLEVRVPFETDLDRLRKVVKQAGTELMADPEY